MPLISLADTAAETQAKMGGMSPQMGPSDGYPCLCLEMDELTKLGIPNPQVGDEYMMVARVRVKSTSSYDSETSDGPDGSATFAMLEASLTPDKKQTMEEIANKMYGTGA